MIVLAWVGSGIAIHQSLAIPDECRNSPVQDYQELLPSAGSGSFSDSLFMRVASTGSYCFFCYAIVTFLPTVQSEMAEPSKLGTAAKRACFVTSLVLVSVMTVSYWGYGNYSPDNIISGFRH